MVEKEDVEDEAEEIRRLLRSLYLIPHASIPHIELCRYPLIV